MANRLAVLLHQRQIRQDVVASAIKVTPATISRWCSNTSQPSMEKLYLLAAYLNVDFSELLYGETKTVTFQDKIHLSILGSDDAFLHLVMGTTDLLNLQKTMFVLRSDFPDNSMQSYPLTLFGYANLYQPTNISMIEVGEIIEHCKFTTLSVENCKEQLRLTFLCPSRSVMNY